MRKGIIETIEEVKIFFDVLKNNYNLIPKPGEKFESYINNGERIFTDDQAKYFNTLMKCCLEICEKEKVILYDFLK